ncbi:MAG: porin [Paracoccaceae bacterium]
MKKILFATTALIATASVAAADVNFSGYGRFGLKYDGNATGDEKETFLTSRFRLNIDGDAETDGGVAFSARVRMQADANQDGTAGTAQLSGARFTTQYEGFRVDVGNISGVIDNLPNWAGYEPGLTFFLSQNSASNFADDSFSSTGAGVNGVFAQYAVNDFAVSASYSPSETGAGEQWGVSGQYAGDTFSVALAYASNEPDNPGAGDLGDSDIIALTAAATFGAFTGNLVVGTEDADNDTDDEFDTFWGLSASYELGTATDLVFAYGDGAGDGDVQVFGIGFIQDLGGGVSLKGGIGSVKERPNSAEAVADLGVNFAF